MQVSPSLLKAYLVSSLEWDLPMLEALWHNTPNPDFILEAKAIDIRRSVLAPLFNGWIPKECPVKLGTGSALAEFHISEVVNIIYELGIFGVERTVTFLGYPDPSPRPLGHAILPPSWPDRFRDDVVGFHTAAKLMAEFRESDEPDRVWAGATGERRFEVYFAGAAFDGSEGDEHYVDAILHYNWDGWHKVCVNGEIGYGDASSEVFGAVFKLPRSGDEEWGVLERPRPVNAHFEKSGLEPLTFHETIARRVREFVRFFVVKTKKARGRGRLALGPHPSHGDHEADERDRSPTRT